MQKIVQVHMLPTDKKAVIHESTSSCGQLYARNSVAIVQKGEIGYHLCFTSEEEIKEGDWIIDSAKNVRKALRDANKEEAKSMARGIGLGKIVATTNPELWSKLGSKDTDGGTWMKIAAIPLSFVKQYVEKQVKEVKLEWIEQCERVERNCIYPDCTCKVGLKLDSQGCIIISDVQDTWSDVWTAYCKYRDTHPEIYVGQFLEWLKANYHPPVKK